MEKEKINNKLYLAVDGKYYKEHEIATAYFLCTGGKIFDEDKPGDGLKQFELWVNDLIGWTIKKVVDMDKIPYEDFLSRNQKLLAVSAYRTRNNCTLREAKDYIDTLELKLKKEGIVA
jgi:hypothetical protein